MFGRKKTWYLIAQNGNSVEVTEPDVKSIQSRIEYPIEFEGLAVKASNASEALSLCGIEKDNHDQFFETITNYHNVQFLTTALFVFQESRDDLEALTTIMPVLQEYAQLMNTGISIRNWHKSKSAPKPRDDNWLHVWFYTAPVQQRKTQMLSTFGYSLGRGQRDAFEPSGKGHQIVDHTGQVIAEVVNKCIYILFDLPHSDRNADQLLRLILEQYYTDCVLLEDARDDRKTVFNSQLAELYSQAYGQRCLLRHTKVLEEEKKKQKGLDERVAEATKELVKYSRQQQKNVQLIEALEAMPTPSAELYVGELNGLLNDSAVEHVVVTSNSLIVWTNQLESTSGLSIGKYVVEISFIGDRITAKNIERLDEHGTWCLGDIHVAMAQLIAEYQFVVAAMYMIEYLRQTNGGVR